MKRITNILIVTLIAINFYNCDSYTPLVNKDTDRWSKHELLPSKITTDGEIFYIGILSDRSTFGVYYDSAVQEDSKFYYTRLMQDLGWYKNIEGTWSAKTDTATRNEYGYIYVNPKRKVGVYFNPEKDGYTIYKVKLK